MTCRSVFILQVQYDTGDHVAVLPENSAETVVAAAAALGVPLDTVFTLHLPPGNPQQLSPPFPGAAVAQKQLRESRLGLHRVCGLQLVGASCNSAGLGITMPCGRQQPWLRMTARNKAVMQDHGC